MSERVSWTGPLLAWFVLSAILAVSAHAESQRPGDENAYSPYMSQVETNVVLAGTLDLEALRASHEGSVRVVDLRTEPEGAPAEAAAAAALGLDYSNIPVASAAVDPAQVAMLRREVELTGKNDLLVVHCASGNRAGMLWGAMLLEAGVPLAEAKEAVSGVLTKAPVTAGLEAYAKSLDAGL